MSELIDKLFHHKDAAAAAPNNAFAAIPTSNPQLHASKTATLPSPDQFKSDVSTEWTIAELGILHSPSMPSLGWDKGRTSTLSGTPFWNFGDVLSTTGGVFKHGMSMGAAFYATPSDPLRVDTKDFVDVLKVDFVKPHVSDRKPEGDTEHWGMDTSNVVEVDDGVGVCFAWEIWRDTTGKEVDRGLAISRVTLGEKVPVAERFGELATGPEGLQVGLMTCMKADGYLYMYTNAGPTGIVVGRTKVADAFKPETYSFLRLDGSWVPGIPAHKDTAYGIQTIGQEQGKIHSDNQGSIMWNAYLGRYVLFTCMYGSSMNFYMSENPWGPWSQQYTLLETHGYGVNVHECFLREGEHGGRVLYISSGSMGNVITMWRVEFGY